MEAKIIKHCNYSNFVIVQLKSNNPTKRSMGMMLYACGSGERIKTNEKYDKWRVKLVWGIN